RHPSGLRYEWRTPPGSVPLAALPGEVRALLVDPVDGVDRDGDIPEGQRNDSLYRLARSLVAQGLSRDAMTAALLAATKAKCRPPVPVGGARGTADRAWTQAARPDFERGAPGVAPTAFSTGLGAFLGRGFAPAEPYVEGVLSDEGGGFIAGEEKVGKTFYMLEEALCLTLGVPVCGRFRVPRRRRVSRRRGGRPSAPALCP